MLKIILGSKVLALGSDTARMSFRHKANMGTPKDVMRYSERCLTWFWVQFLTCLGYEIKRSVKSLVLGCRALCGLFMGKCSANFSGWSNVWRNAQKDPGGPLTPLFLCVITLK